MSSERAAWTRFVEERERERAKAKAKRPRTRKSPEPSPEELEQALDDLVDEGEHRPRFSTLSEKALCCQSREM
jgi:hypothetical protein